MKVVSGIDTNMTSIDGLEPDTVYNVHVSATTGGGDGVISVVFSVEVPQGIIFIACIFAVLETSNLM